MMNSVQKKVLPYKKLWLVFDKTAIEAEIKIYKGAYCYGFPTQKTADDYAQEWIKHKWLASFNSDHRNIMGFDLNPNVRHGCLWVLFDLSNGEAHGGHDRKDGGGYIWMFSEYKDAKKHWKIHRDTDRFAELTKPFRYTPSPT